VEKRRFEDGRVLVAFQLPAAVSASTVSVCGDFNGWTPQSHPLTRLGDGSFRVDVPLPAGDRWRFRYLLDGGRWENDWAADDYVPNGLGEDNSVVDLTDTGALPVIDPVIDPAAPAAEAAPAPAAEGAAEGAPEEADGEGSPAEPRRPWFLRRWWNRLGGR
jgi:Carbohydrate-binding module 48 (Isoamylase N-terminal domain)